MKFTMAILIGSIAIALLVLGIEAHSDEKTNMVRVLMGKPRIKRELVLFKTREQEAEEVQQAKVGGEGNAGPARKLTREELEQKEREEWDSEDDDNSKYKENAGAHVTTVEKQTINHRSNDNEKEHEDQIVDHRKNQASTGFPKPSNMNDRFKHNKRNSKTSELVWHDPEKEEVKTKKSRGMKGQMKETSGTGKGGKIQKEKQVDFNALLKMMDESNKKMKNTSGTKTQWGGNKVVVQQQVVCQVCAMKKAMMGM